MGKKKITLEIDCNICLNNSVIMLVKYIIIFTYYKRFILW